MIIFDHESDDYRSAAGQAVTKLLYAFNAPFEYEDQMIDFGASIRITTSPQWGGDFLRCLKAPIRPCMPRKKPVEDSPDLLRCSV